MKLQDFILTVIWLLFCMLSYDTGFRHGKKEIIPIEKCETIINQNPEMCISIIEDFAC